MHRQALDWIRAHATDEPVAVLDIGGRDINGSPRTLFPQADPYVVLDILDGPGVDIVADAASWTPDRAYDVVVCAEVFEHTPDWLVILETAYKAVRPGGRLIVTTAAPGRPEHSAIDGQLRLHSGEWYGNIDPADLGAALAEGEWRGIAIDVQKWPADVRAVAVR